MKKYLILAAFAGAIAFLSMSYFAQAEDHMAAPAPAAAETMAAPAVEPTAFEKDFAECEALASAATTEGAAPSAEEKAAACKKCLIGKGHTEEEIAKEEEKRKAAEAAKAPAAPEAAPAPAPQQ